MRTSDFDIRSEAFRAILTLRSRVEVAADGFQFIEGPAWFPSEQALVFSDILASEQKRWPAKDGVTTLRTSTNRCNGNARDREGRLVTAGHSSRSIWRTERDGAVTVLAERYKGERLNSPNDILVKSDGTIWFTDPPYAVKAAEREQPWANVFRFDPATSALDSVANDMVLPNGLCFSPDERLLYVADSSRARRHVRVFDVAEGKRLAHSRVFCAVDAGIPDGMRVDSAGRLYCTAGDGIHVFSPAGELLGKILVPKTPANCCFGGPDLSTLFITARETLYQIGLAAQGATWPAR